MICGALQTLNEDAFEDVAANDRQSPSGELAFISLQQCLAPISEELSSPISSRNFDFDSNILQTNNNSITSAEKFYETNNQTATIILIPNNKNNNNFNDTPL